MRLFSFVAPLSVLVLVLASCGGDTPPPLEVDGGGVTDLGGGASDARVICSSDVDCNDGLFCNGREMCAPASSMADVRGCTPGDAPCSAGETCDETANDCRVTCEDLDGDGDEATACGGDDCDDTNASRYPGNTETCDSDDEDCNDATFGFVDADGDGVASSACCNGTACGGDCNDGNADVRPGALDGPPDLCNTIDDDCDGSVDEGCPCTTGTETPCYMGAMSTRGVGRCADGFQLCVGGMLQATCNDQSLPETEICDTLDNDCDGMTNEDVLRRYYRDGDGDGFGLLTETIEACSPPTGYVSASNDCADDDNNRNPGAFDGCNGIDDDCDGTTDEGAPSRVFHPDADGDGFGAPGTMMSACDPPAGYILDGTDCDDTNAGRHPGAFDACNLLDDDCDMMVDEGAPPRVFHRDADGDGFGAIAGLPPACDPPAGSVLDGSDCDDADSARHPGAYERCDGPVPPATLPLSVDDDCDGAINEGCACSDGAVNPCGTSSTGVCRRGTQTCVSGALTTCAGNVEPSAEVCNGRDDNCDGTTDETVSTTCYADADGDGRGAGLASQLCGPSIGVCPTGWSTLSNDCNDSNATISPVAAEACNRRDDDCDGMADEGFLCAQGATRAGSGAYLMCASIAGLFTCNATCTAETFNASPPPEMCNGADENCNGVNDDGFACARNSTGNACVTTCGTAGTYTCSATCTVGACRAATETCNGCDDDGDGTADTGFFCVQGATRSGTGPYLLCPSVPGLARCNATCTAETFSGSAPPEMCDGADNNCNGVADDGFACVSGSSSNGCTTGCGTPGTYTCSATCSVGMCRAGMETCNGCDDDNAGGADNGFVCVLGTSQACTTACGTAGTQRCMGDCSGYDACRGVTETCNGCDDDIDGSVDEGLTCAQGRDYSCTTACGTAGRLICNSACTGYTAACAATYETCNYCDDDGDGAVIDEAYAAGATSIVDSETCASDYLLYGTPADAASCLAIPTQARLISGTGGGVNQAAALWARRPMLVGYNGFHLRVTATVIGCTTDPDAGWAVVFAENSAVSLGASGALGSGVPTTMRGLSVRLRFFDTVPGGTIPDRVTAYVGNGLGGNTLIGTGIIPVGNSCGRPLPSPLSAEQVLDVTYRPAIPELLRQASLTIKSVASGSLETTLIDLVGGSVPTWAPGTLLRFGMTGASGAASTAAILPILPVLEQVGVCDTPYDGQVRIDGGTASGRLEIFHSGRWGTICEDLFAVVDAGVACRQLGYGSGTVRTDVAEGPDPIWLDDLGCTGTELGVGICAHPPWGTSNCTHVRDVGVACVP